MQKIEIKDKRPIKVPISPRFAMQMTGKAKKSELPLSVFSSFEKENAKDLGLTAGDFFVNLVNDMSPVFKKVSLPLDEAKGPAENTLETINL